MRNQQNWLFKEEIKDWESWAKVFQNKQVFAPMIDRILPNLEIKNCIPGTNAVFQVGDYIVKIFAPAESGINADSDYETELYGIKRAQALGISVPKLISSGSIEDKYVFSYIIMEYIEGEGLGKALPQLDNEEKYVIGKKLRKITNKLNTKVEPFHYIDIVHRAYTNERWNAFSENFRHEHKEFLRQYKCEKRVFVHGDMNPDNVLLGKDGELYVIDFADGVLAPVAYEHACIAVELFRLNPALLTGFFGEYNPEELVDMCMEGLLLHDFGANILIDFLGEMKKLEGLTELRKQLLARF